MEISSALVDLLRLYDCVIIPDLGGFIANYRSAEMDLAGNKFLPPKKEVIFSSKLNKNDGLLVNHISETEGVGYLEARKMISEFTDEAWSKLENGEIIDFPRVGTLSYDKNEKLIFEPALTENLLLDAYGMESFHFPELKHHETIVPKTVFRDKEAVRPVFSSRTMKRVLIAIPILAALAFIPLSTTIWNDGFLKNHQVSSTTSLPLADSPRTVVNAPDTHLIDESNKQTEAEKEPQTALAEVKPDAIEEVVNPVPTPVASKAKYHIIGGCFRNSENADRMVSAMTSKGFQPEVETLKNGLLRVTIQSYANRNDALAALDSLRQAEPGNSYWLMAD